MIDGDILYIQMIAENLIKELKAFNKDLKKVDKSYLYPLTLPNKHKTSFNRLRIELNNKCLELSQKFKEYK